MRQRGWLIFAVAATVQTGAAAQEAETAPYPSNGVVLGNGWLSNEGMKTSEVCIVGDEQSLSGERRKLEYTELTDTSTLMRALSISAKAKAKSILGGSGSVSFNYDRTVTMKSDSLQILVDFTIQKGSSYLVPRADAVGSGERAIMLRAPLVELARTNPVEFRRRCGDGFVSTVVRRAGLWGIYTFRTKSEEEKRDVRGKMKGSFATFSASASTREITETFEKAGRLSIQYLQEGGEGLPAPTTDAAFRQLVSDMGSKTGTPVESLIVLGDYRSLPNYPVSGSADPSDAGELADQYYRLSSLSQAINEWLGPGVRASYTLTEQQVRATQDDIRREMDRIESVLRACIAGPAPCRYPSDMARHDYDFRVRMPVDVTTILGWNHHYATIDKFFQDATVAYGITRDPNVLTNATAQAENVRGEMRVVEAKARYQYWIAEPNAARCDRNERALCLLNSQLQVYQQRIR